MFTEVFADIAKAQQRAISLKYVADRKTDDYVSYEKRQANAVKLKSMKIDLEQAEVAYYEANLSYNIMVIHFAYETIEKFKVNKRLQFQALIKQICQQTILQENELHGFFKFILNFYKNEL